MTRVTAKPKGPAGQPPCDAVETAQRRARATYFVGRDREVKGFAALLAAGEAPRIVFVHGAGGIGKSSLLDRFRHVAERLGIHFAHLDARLLPAMPDTIARAAHHTLADRGAQVESHYPQVLALDHAEQLTALDGWLRAELIPGLPAGIVLVLAGRQRPSPEWRADPGLSHLLVDYQLDPLEPDAVSEYLQRRGVTGQQRGAIRDFARGHPLALALATDQVIRAPETHFDASSCPDLIHDLVRWLLRDIDDSSYLQAIMACATVRVLDEPLLAAMLGRDDVRAEFDWLAEQHFVEQRATGLVIHDLVREVVVRDLRGRNLANHHDLIRRTSGYLLDGLDTAGQYATLQAVGDTIYALRHEPYVQRQFPFGDVQCYPDTAGPEEYPALTAEVARLEGVESATWFEYWLKREDSELIVMRDSTREPVALALILRFGAGDITGGPDDPCIQAWFRYLRRHAPLRGGEQAMLGRFLLAHGTHQARTSVWAHMGAQMNGLMFTPGISLLGYVSDLAYDWGGVQEHAAARILPETEYGIGGRRYAITVQDMRREPPLEWARNCVERILRDGNAPELQPSDVILLDKPEFAHAVAQALHNFHDEAALSRNPLLQSPMLRRYATRRDTDSLRALLQEQSAGQLAGGRRQCTLHEVLKRTCFQPAAKQQAAAAALHVSERTLRRRLREAETQLAEALWRLETGAG